MVLNSKAFKAWIKRKFNEYFVEKNLSSDQLKTQITVLERILKTVVVLVVLNFIRIMVKVLQARK